MHWTETARRNHIAAQRELANRVNSSSISVPVGDSAWTAPGWISVGHFFSCVPDSAYPWDPAVLRALRSILPDAMPMIERSVYRWSNYHEHGRIDAPIVIVRHAIGRSIIDPRKNETLHNFHCEMPSTPVDGLRIPGRTMAACRPNKVETHWYDNDNKPYGPDLPGAYLPFNWDMYDICKEFADSLAQALQDSLRGEDEFGNPIARHFAAELVTGEKVKEEKADRSTAAEQAYIAKDIANFYSIQPSDVELKEKLLSGN